MDALIRVNTIFGLIFAIFYSYHVFYMLYSFFSRKKYPHPHSTPKKHRFAVLISARNEEMVIGQLIDSIHEQTYDQDLITIFVIADNCTDHTEELARSKGAVVYRRKNLEWIGKGYAMDELMIHLHEDFPEDAFDGYFVFDADNVLSPTFIEEMNKTFSDGYQIITSYRNSKNFGDNWISAGYGLSFLREAKYLNQARMLLGTSSAVSGTGYMFSREILAQYEGRWPFYLLTEDLEFTAHSIARGHQIGYCADAIFYDEQPTSFSQSWKQRMRWAKGSLQVFQRCGTRLIRKALSGDFSSFDMTMILIPLPAFFFLLSLINLIALIVCLITGNQEGISTFSGYVLNFLSGMYFGPFVQGFLTVLTERRRIYATRTKKFLSIFTFPIFVFISMPIALRALYKKVNWDPIPHTKVKSVSDIQKEGEESQ